MPIQRFTLIGMKKMFEVGEKIMPIQHFAHIGMKKMFGDGEKIMPIQRFTHIGMKKMFGVGEKVIPIQRFTLIGMKKMFGDGEKIMPIQCFAHIGMKKMFGIKEKIMPIQRFTLIGMIRTVWTKEKSCMTSRKRELYNIEIIKVYIGEMYMGNNSKKRSSMKRISIKKTVLVALVMVFALGICACGEINGKQDENAAQQEEIENTVVRVGSMKGPTTLGLLSLMDNSEKGTAKGNYEFTMVTAADELLPMVIKGELDIALVPANVAAILYQKTEGGISVIDINTLGVLYMLSGDTSIESVSDLKGKTIYLTGKGTSPDFVLQYLLSAGGLSASDVKLEYKSEPTEVAVLLAENPDAIGLLPQPFVTVACAQNSALYVVLDMTEEWEKVQGEEGSSLVTGVTVVRKEFLETHSGAVANFMEEHKQSAEYVNANVKEAALLAVAAGIVAKEPIAEGAIPNCNITYIEGTEMKQALGGYLAVLYEQAPEAVGGALPEEDFYYIP